MDLRVIGCHGGETPKHRTSAFLVNDQLAVDAGSLTSGLTVEDQARLVGCVVSHAHLDHIRDLATIADNRCQMLCPPLVIAATPPTIRALKAHFFNDVIWPDFTKIPSGATPTIVYQELALETEAQVGQFTVKPIAVSHTIDASAFIVSDGETAFAYSGDTGPTERLWQVLNAEPGLKALFMEVSFPNHEQAIATASGHHTPRTLAADLQKYRSPADLPTFLYHMKPVFQREVELECAKLAGLNLHVTRLFDHYQIR